MLDKLLKIKAEHDDLTRQMGEPEIASDHQKYQKLARRESELRPLVELITRYQKAINNISAAGEMLEQESDKELLEMAKEDLEKNKEQKAILEEQIKVALIPKDPNDDKNVILEVRPAAGGEEAGLFAGELARMYLRYAANKDFKVELIHKTDAEAGGMKEFVARIIGQGAYSRFKYESGVHRVQRIPKTEAQGRVHTSTVTVAVLPEAEEVDIEIRPQDLRIDTFRASGAGGQNVNKTESAVRITHLPSGLAVACQTERSQIQNREHAMNILRAKLYQIQEEKLQKERGQMRLSQVGTGERNEKIRTYNFPQDRVTDHRVHQSWSNLPVIMEGEMQEIVDGLTLEDQARKLAEASGKKS